MYDFCCSIGHGRRRRSLAEASALHNDSSEAVASDNTTHDQYTRFKENLEYTVVMPGELFHRTPIDGTCATSMMIAAALGALLFMSALLVSIIHLFGDLTPCQTSLQPFDLSALICSFIEK